ncbi:MAG: hypothetical protein AVO35_05330 [Candidatus Aegiribacteria sp. MLS_C]|nr:MAG: hypothetical protein AVO35_05330 [Candidatus Aegiribacteria sp. MLS_C]
MTGMDLERLRRSYAELLVGTGVNLQEGQPLLVRTEPVQRGFVHMLAEAAYGRGASFVNVEYYDPALSRIRLDRSVRNEYTAFVPSYTEDMYAAFIEEGWASLSLRGPDEPDIMEGADPGRMAAAGKASSMAMRGFLKGISANRISWNVCLHPSRKWAGKVLGSENDWEVRIWELLAPILRLDAADPSAAWMEHDAELKRRCAYMNGAGYDQIRFVGPGTDLYVGMAPDRTFVGGRCTNRAGVGFFPNIPTEEIFSTPHRKRVRGTARTTRPVEVMGASVEGAWFRFEDGRVVDFGADRNREVLEKYLEFDTGSSSLGEVALVDAGSPVFRSGRTFHSILFDENAASHIALGNGYADCIEGGTGMTDDELEAAGCNSSLVHTDFMIGSEEVSVYGVLDDGTEMLVMEKGRFVI